MIFGPMLHVGCASASDGVTPARSRGPARGTGRPDAVSTSPTTVCGVAALEALEERRVLAVDRQQEPSTPLPGCDRELAGRDEALLVRERERHAVLERPDRRAHSGEADHRVQDDVGRAPLEQRDGIAADLDVLDAVLRRQSVEGRRAGLQRAEREIGMRGDDVDRLPADRSGRTEQGDASHRRKHA